MSYPGLLYDGESARPVPVTWRVAGGELLIQGPEGERRFPVGTVRATSRLASIRRVVHLPGGAQLHSDDTDAVDQLVSRRGLEAVTDRLERHAVAVAASLVITVGLAGWFFALGLPVLADRAARAIPPEVEAAIGGQVIVALENSVLSPTTLDEETQRRFQALFDEFVATAPDGERYRLEFRYMRGHPANAFALPGGAVVFTDALIEMIEEDEEFLAVLAHEIGHHRERHLTRSVLQSSAVVMLGTIIAGDVSGASAVMIGLPTFLLENHYSRSFEAEADRFAFAELQARDISPDWFARIMGRLAASQSGDTPGDKEENLLSYASTHPPTAARVAAARQAGEGLPPPGRLIADRAVARLAAESAPDGSVDISPEAVTGCLTGSYTVEGEEGTVEWVQRTAPDGTLTLRTTYNDGSVGRSHGYWALKGRYLAEYVTDLDAASGGEPPTGIIYRYRLLGVGPDRLEYGDPDTGEESAADRVECPEGL